MNRSLACLVAAGLALTAAGPTSVIASGPRDGLVEVEIDGAPQKRYAHDGRWYGTRTASALPLRCQWMG
jgi:hypothetical protein